jgi:hypothetical protein
MKTVYPTFVLTCLLECELTFQQKLFFMLKWAQAMEKHTLEVIELFQRGSKL